MMMIVKKMNIKKTGRKGCSKSICERTKSGGIKASKMCESVQRGNCGKKAFMTYVVQMMPTLV